MTYIIVQTDIIGRLWYYVSSLKNGAPHWSDNISDAREYSDKQKAQARIETITEHYNRDGLSFYKNISVETTPNNSYLS